MYGALLCLSSETLPHGILTILNLAVPCLYSEIRCPRNSWPFCSVIVAGEEIGNFPRRIALSGFCGSEGAAERSYPFSLSQK